MLPNIRYIRYYSITNTFCTVFSNTNSAEELQTISFSALQFSKMSSKLSIDILSIIFEELEKENDKELYSCIFVNREWCQIVIPFLWKNPWKIFNETDWMNDNKYQDVEIRYKILFRSFLTLMTKEQKKEFLKSNGIENFIGKFKDKK